MGHFPPRGGPIFAPWYPTVDGNKCGSIIARYGAICSQFNFSRTRQQSHEVGVVFGVGLSKIVEVSNGGHFGHKFIVEPNMTCVVFFRGWLLSSVIARHAPERFVLNGVAVVNATDLISHT